tara:strand:- start:547 stop:717 length:171 start_codon:yes stop_codon:yes gene_type:complete
MHPLQLEPIMIHPVFALAPTDFPLTITAVLIAIALWAGERAFRNRQNQSQDKAKDE